MSKFPNILLFIIIFQIVVSAQNSKVELTIKTNLPESYIFIQNKLAGRGEIGLRIGPGKYAVRVVENIYMWNARRFQDTIKITGNENNLILKFDFNKSKLLDSSPQNAAVYKGSEILGFTPLLLASLPDTNFVLKKTNYLPVELNPKLIGNNAEIRLQPVNKIKNGSFVEKNELFYLLGTAVALGVTSAYFKLKADKKYDAYLTTRDKNLLNETERLDILSGISVAALQINIGFLIYKLIGD